MNQFIVNSKTLFSALDFARKARPLQSVVPILEDFLMVVKDKTLHVTASDLHTTVTVSLGVEVFKSASEAFDFILEDRAYHYLKVLEEQPITVKHDPQTNMVYIASDEASVKLGFDQKPGDYPKTPVNANAAPLFKLSHHALKEFDGLLQYASNDELRPALMGISFNTRPDGMLDLVATDGHTLKVKSVPIMRLNNEKPKDGRLFILKPLAARILSEVRRSKLTPDDEGFDVCLSEAGSEVFFTGTHRGFDVEIVSRTIDEKYPDYMNVIPAKKLLVSSYTASRRKMMALLNQTKPFRNAVTQQVELRLSPDKCDLFTQDYHFDSEFTAKMDGTLTGNEIRIGFNAKFLLKALEQITDEEFTLEMEAPNKAALIRDSTTVCLTMPVMLNQYA